MPRSTDLREVVNALLRRLWLCRTEAEGRVAKDRCVHSSDRQARTDKAKGFEVLPRRWIVGRTFAWLGRCRRLAKNWEKFIASAEAWITIANIRVLTRCLARDNPPVFNGARR